MKKLGSDPNSGQFTLRWTTNLHRNWALTSICGVGARDFELYLLLIQKRLAMKYLLSFIVSLLFTACATNSPHTTISTNSLPPITWKYVNSTSYEANSPGLGTSERYTSEIGWVDVYSYDMKRPNWTSGVTDLQFSAHFNETIASVRQLEKMGRYKNVVIIGPKDVNISNLTFRTVSFTYEMDGKPTNSVTYLTAKSGKLLKYRISMFVTNQLSIESVADAFIRENLTKSMI
jgi:hypothetical protein